MAYHRAALVAARPPAWDAAAARRGWRDSGVALVGSRRGLSTTPKPKNELSEEEALEAAAAKAASATKEGADGSSRTPGIEPMDTMGDMVVPASKSDRAAMAKKYFSDYLVAPGAQLQRMMRTLPAAALAGTKSLVLWMATFSRELASDPRKTLGEAWAHFKEEMAHYWVGTKLLWADLKIASKILVRALQGSRLSRRERIQLVRTSTDLFRLVPFALFVIIPFMEVFLPVALKLFPSMLPSTFEQSMAKEEAMKRELKMRIAMAGFMKDMLREMAKDVSG
jgi:hypothetical protein